MSEDMTYQFEAVVGDDDGEVACVSDHHPGSWTVSRNGSAWEAQGPNGKTVRTFAGTYPRAAAIGYCVQRMVEEMESGACYG